MKQDPSPLYEVLEFWFTELMPEDWFNGGVELDKKIQERFGDLHEQVAANEFWRLREDARCLLAEVVVLDQFSRQIYRNQGQAFTYDRQALALAQQAIEKGFDADYSDTERQFLYMPFMHSESRAIHVDALLLFETLENQQALKYEKIHKDIIDQFGRYPHRNEVLGRPSIAKEIEYLKYNHEDFF